MSLRAPSLFLVMLLLAACSALPISVNYPAMRVELGQAFTVRRGIPVEIVGEDLVVTFDKVLSDGRCPVHMSCTAMLPVEVAVRLRGGDEPLMTTLSAHTTDGGDVIAQAPGVTPVYRFGPYTVALERVVPYPDADSKLLSTPYQVTLRVTRDRTIEVSPDTQAPVPARLGEPVTLAIGQRAIFAPAAFQVSVAQVEDNRCPKMVICELPTIVIVELNAQLDGALHKATVGGVTDEDGRVTGPLMETRGIPWAQVGPYTIELTDVTPYPEWNIETAPEAYAVTLVVSETAQPPATPEPTVATKPPLVITTSDDVPVLSIDSGGHPILCVSYRALTLFAAGVSTEAPFAGTALPIGAVSLSTQAAGDAICAMFFDDEWQMADTLTIDVAYAPALPESGAYWVWDPATAATVIWEPGQ
ncbi:MAG: hypothetical protein KDE01_10140 [Caldilineaceae bacterium]|nr:hypothetical protein [Caldilineaceae bacterium]